MRALVATGDPSTLVELREVEPPRPAPDQAVIAVEATSVNHGEVEWLSQAVEGWRPGWDIAGHVVEAAADGSGPPAGARVAAFLGEGAWGERIAVPTQRVGIIPDALGAAAAAGVPVVGLTALRALRVGGLLAGRRVLVLGAGGAIGRVAVQLATAAGATVTAQVRATASTAVLRRSGASVVIGHDALDGPFEVVLDGIGGPALGAALRKLTPGGVVVLYGDAAHEPTTFNTGDLFLLAPEARIHALRMDASAQPERFAADIAHLAGLVAGKELDLGLADPVVWADAPAVLASALGRRPERKPILTFDAA